MAVHDMIVNADAVRMPLVDQSVHMIMTSPPYWALRDYGLNGAGIGLEATLDEYLEHMRAVGWEMWRVLRDDGTLWLNMGDVFATSVNGRKAADIVDDDRTFRDKPLDTAKASGLKPKDLVGLPWRVAFALQEDGWYLRSDIIWAKPNPMPESVTDRPTKSHEYLFLLSKRPRYYYDAEAIKEPTNDLLTKPRKFRQSGAESVMRNDVGRDYQPRATRNKRDVWTIPTQPYKGAHFATFPEKLVEPCILAGSSPKACGVCGAPWERMTERRQLGERNDHGRTHSKAEQRCTSPGAPPERGWEVERETTGWRPTCDHDDDSGRCLVFDPFCGSGTVGAVACRLGREFVGLDLSRPYLALAQERIGAVTLGMPL
jgi:DNA modification methylase